MRRICGQADPKPYSSPGLEPTCMIMAFPQPGSIVTVLVSESVWRRYDRIFWLRSNHSPVSREPLCTGPQPTGPVMHHSLRVCYSTWRQAVRAMWVPRVIPRLWAAFSGHAYRPVPFCVTRAKQRRQVPQHTMPEPGRAPGLPAGPGCFFGHCGEICMFPSLTDVRRLTLFT